MQILKKKKRGHVQTAKTETRLHIHVVCIDHSLFSIYILQVPYVVDVCANR